MRAWTRGGVWWLAAWLAAATVAPAQVDRLLNELIRNRTPGFTYDYAGVMSADSRVRTDRVLEQLEAKTGAQVKVVTLRTLEGGEVSDFANRLYAGWGIGQKDKNNGVLLLAAIEDRKVWIEVGYGLEAVIPDAAAGRMLDEYVIPRFKAGDFSGGMEQGAVAIAGAVARAAGVTLDGMPPPAVQQLHPPPRWVVILFVLLFLFAFRRMPWWFWLLPSGSRRGSSWGGGGFSGGFGGGFGGGGGGFGGFGGGISGGGGAGRSW